MNKIKILTLIVIVMILIFGIAYYKKISYKKVKMGINIEMAEKIIKDRNDYIIVSIDGISGGGVYKCETGKYKGKYVKLIGREGTYPDTNCSPVLTWPKQNRFLIKIKNLKENIIDNEMYKTELDITCESYEFIIPIKREYSCSKHERYFYPENYIDEYDVLYGDYEE